MNISSIDTKMMPLTIWDYLLARFALFLKQQAETGTRRSLLLGTQLVWFAGYGAAFVGIMFVSVEYGGTRSGGLVILILLFIAFTMIFIAVWTVACWEAYRYYTEHAPL